MIAMKQQRSAISFFFFLEKKCNKLTPLHSLRTFKAAILINSISRVGLRFVMQSGIQLRLVKILKGSKIRFKNNNNLRELGVGRFES